jgi:hypothetical protein
MDGFQVNYSEYLSNDASKVVCLANVDLMRIMTPAEALLMCMLPNEFPKLTSIARLIFILVHNATACGQAASFKETAQMTGNHWSLLLVHVASQKAYHFDSMSETNLIAAGRVTEAPGKVLGTNMEFVEMKMLQHGNYSQGDGNACGPMACLLLQQLYRV